MAKISDGFWGSFAGHRAMTETRRLPKMAHGQHLRRAIDAGQRNAGLQQRKGDPSGAGHQLQHRPAGLARFIEEKRQVESRFVL